ncbi:MAG: hypothetical protein ACUVQY_10640 [Thermoproteota archaeon]
MPDIQSFNAELERIRNKIEGIGNVEDKKAYYLEHKDIFDKTMYPHPSSYSVLKVPIIPLPPGELRRLYRVLSSPKTSKTNLDEEYLEMLKAVGIVHADRNYVYPTDEGRLSSEILKIVLE